MMDEEIDEQTKLLRSIVKLLLDREHDDKSEAEKAAYLAESGFTQKEIANILNKSEGTVSSQLSRR